MKTALKVLAGVFTLMIVAIIVIPLVVDVDHYRPQILKAANQKINGKLELGKLKLSLWGKINISIDGLKLVDSQNHVIAEVKDASFNMPYTSVLSGSPLITLHMANPNISIIKNKQGQMNVMTLMKTEAAAEQKAAQKSADQKSDDPSADAAKSIALPALALNARVGVLIEHAKLLYQDDSMQLKNTIDDFNLRIRDFSLSRSTELELWADLKTQMGDDLKVEGPLRLEASLTPEISGGEFKSAAVIANLTADDLDIQKGVMFHKKKGVPSNFKIDGKLDQQSLNLKQAMLRFHNAEITLSGIFSQVTGADLAFKAKPIELKSWSDLVPMLKEYELEGAIQLDGTIKGKPESLGYRALLGIQSFSMKGPNLKSKPIIQGQVAIATDQIEKFSFDLKGPGNDLQLSGKLVSFTKPQIQFAVKSKNGLDLDQWIEFPKKSASAQLKLPAIMDIAYAAATAAPDDYDAMLEPLKKNDIFRAMALEGSIALPFVKAMNVKIDQIQSKVQMQGGAITLSGISLKLFDGTAQGNMTTKLLTSKPEYSMKLSVTGFDMSKAVESQFVAFKNTFTGKLSTSVEGAGSSFNSDLAKRRLQMKGNFSIANSTFKTLDITKAVNEALSSSIDKLGNQIPMLKGKKIAMNSNSESKYESITGTFTIRDGILNAPDFYAKAATKSGIDLRGSTQMGLVDESIDARWEVSDVQKMTGADQLNVDIAGKMIKNVLAKGENDPVILPIKVGCKWSAPCPNYSEVPAYLAGVAAKRLASGAGDAAKAKAASAVQDAIKKNLGDGIGNSIGGGLKKLFGN
jgi:hypothetical protein